VDKTGRTFSCRKRYKAYTVFFFGLILISVGFIACSNPDSKAENRTVFYINEANNISSLDPAFAKDLANLNVCNQLYNGLVQLDSNLAIQPAIAKSWSVSNQGKLYTFCLRNDVFFHDNIAFPAGIGRRIMAADFVYSFNRIVSDKLVSPGAWIFNQVEHQANIYSFSAPNDSTFVVKLENPFSPFLTLLSMQYCSVVPFEAVEYFGDNFRKNPVGTGPFYLKLWEEDAKMVLLRNPKYFEKVGTVSLPYLDAVNYSFLVDKQSEFLTFILGKLDYFSGIEAGFKDEILTETGEINEKYKHKINLQRNAYLNTEYIGITFDTNLQHVKESPLRHLKFRQALNYAIDREKLLRYLRNNIGTPGNGGILPSVYSPENQNYGYTYNKQKAEQLLIELKNELNVDHFPSIVLVASAQSLDLMKFVQHQLAEIDLQINIELMQWAALKEVVANTRSVFFRASWIADYPDPENYLSLFYSANFAPSGPNYTHYSNPIFDSLYNLSIEMESSAEKQTVYRAMDSILMTDAVIIPLYYDEVLRFTQKNIKNIPPNPMNLLNLKFVLKENIIQ
jgi:peptide/nickel transport system substrate-binding protein